MVGGAYVGWSCHPVSSNFGRKRRVWTQTPRCRAAPPCGPPDELRRPRRMMRRRRTRTSCCWAAAELLLSARCCPLAAVRSLAEGETGP
eukprot:scaffold54171_cov69-Phaeocystis_antarctica.AAC.5